MNRLAYHFIIFCSAALLTFACSHQPEKQQVETKPAPHNQTGTSIKKPTANLEQAKIQVATLLAEKYYDHQKKPKVLIYILPATGSMKKEPHLPAYISGEISAYLSESHQFKLVPENYHDLDCIVSMAVLGRDTSNGARLLVSILKPGDKIHMYAKILDIDDILTNPAYASFQKTNVLSSEQESWPLLVIEAVNAGEGYNLVEKEFSATVTRNNDIDLKGSSADKDLGTRIEDRMTGSQSTTTEAASYKDYGKSSYYPMKQKVKINGREYNLSGDDIFFNEKVKPGLLKIEVSFNEGYWDAKASQQREGKKHKKSFTYRMEKNKNIKILTKFICNHSQKGIDVKAYRMK
jgi:hypothetical protein